MPRIASFLIPVALLLFTGCSGIRALTADGPHDVRSPDADSLSPDERLVLEDSLRIAITPWIGTPHRLGGTDMTGVDCSAFVQRIFSDALGLDIPRTTDAQIDTGAELDREALRAGDLVFFRTSRKDRHVGIVLDGMEFAHASSSSGVRVSRLDNPYWVRTYRTGRRHIIDRSSTSRVFSLPPATAEYGSTSTDSR